MHVPPASLGKVAAVGLPQGIDARVAVLLSNLTVLVAATVIKSPVALLCHLRPPNQKLYQIVGVGHGGDKGIREPFVQVCEHRLDKSAMVDGVNLPR